MGETCQCLITIPDEIASLLFCEITGFSLWEEDIGVTFSSVSQYCKSTGKYISSLLWNCNFTGSFTNDHVLKDFLLQFSF